MSRSVLRALPVVAIAVLLSGGTAAGALDAPWWQVEGTGAGDHLGWSAAGVPDLDGDGLGDVIVGAPDDDVAGRTNAGSVLVLSGADGSLLWSTAGDTAADLLGYAVAGVSDLDGDGYGDVVVGAPRDDPSARIDAGSVHVYSGASGLLLWSAAGDTAGDLFGSSVAGVPDLDGDGAGDVVVGAPDDDPLGIASAGCAFAFSGATGALLWKAGGTAALDHLGHAVGGLYDTDGDGLGEVVVGVPDDDVPGRTGAGSVHLFSGATGGLLWTVSGDSAGDRLGCAVAGVADLEGLGLAGVAAGANGDDPLGRANAGSVLALSGASGATLWSAAGALANDGFGLSVAGGADVDGDGYGDVIGGAPLARVLGLATAGYAAVLSGLSGATTWQTSGAAADDEVGRAVAFVPDVDGDGRGDVVVGASDVRNAAGLGDAGRVVVYATEEETLDVTAPVITCPDDLRVEATGPAGAVVSFAVVASDETDPTPTVACEPAAGSTFPLGTTTVTCTATDASGNQGTCSFTVTVQDTTAPTVACALETTSLWSPNHRMEDVGLAVTASDAVDEGVLLSIAVTSDEASAGDEADAALDGSALSLRADRDGAGDGRVFLVVVTATDAAGNSSSTCATVVVPKSRSSAHGKSAASQATHAMDAMLAAGGTPPAGYVTVLAPTTLP